MRKIRIGTRGSNLALWQAGHIRDLLEKTFPENIFERVIIKTEGDRDQSSSLTKIGGRGVFTKAIEDALLNDEIDIAIHSLKDLPSDMTPGLMLGAVPQRGPVEDVLITRDGITPEDLPEKAKVASGSIRRRSQLLRLRPDIQIADLRGNIDTRIKKLYEQDLDAIIMARAAIERLQIKDIKYHVLTTDQMLPAVGQGAIGVQIRENDMEVAKIVSSINHEPTYQAVTAERRLLNVLDTGCLFPVGGHAEVNGKDLLIRGYVGSEDGKTIIYDEATTASSEPAKAGQQLAEKLIEKGALTILKTYQDG